MAVKWQPRAIRPVLVVPCLLILVKVERIKCSSEALIAKYLKHSIYSACASLCLCDGAVNVL